MNEIKTPFSVSFDGDALKEHEMPADILASSILALNVIASKAVPAEIGQDPKLMISSKFRPGSVIVDFILEYQPIVEETLSGLAILKEVIELFLWLKGRVPDKVKESNNHQSIVYNSTGETRVYNNCSINVFNQPRIKSQMDEFTKPLDQDGINSLRIQSETGEDVVIDKSARSFLKNDEEIVSQNEATVVLEIISPVFDGSNKAWRLSDGDASFLAVMADLEFLKKVTDGKYSFKKGTSIKALIRTVQKRGKRLITERTVLEVLEVLP